MKAQHNTIVQSIMSSKEFEQQTEIAIGALQQIATTQPSQSKNIPEGMIQLPELEGVLYDLRADLSNTIQEVSLRQHKLETSLHDQLDILRKDLALLSASPGIGSFDGTG